MRCSTPRARTASDLQLPSLNTHGLWAPQTGVGRLHFFLKSTYGGTPQSEKLSRNLLFCIMVLFAPRARSGACDLDGATGHCGVYRMCTFHFHHPIGTANSCGNGIRVGMSIGMEMRMRVVDLFIAVERGNIGRCRTCIHTFLVHEVSL